MAKLFTVITTNSDLWNFPIFRLVQFPQLPSLGSALTFLWFAVNPSCESLIIPFIFERLRNPTLAEQEVLNLCRGAAIRLFILVQHSVELVTLFIEVITLFDVH
ncbi:hypothetical protein D3C79_862220 [compost metagenome]